MRHRIILSLIGAAAMTVPLAGAADTRVALAAKQQDASTVRRLLADKVEVNAPQADGSTALHWAAHWDDAALVRELLAVGARPDVATDQGITPLALAALNGSVQVTGLLLAAGANPNVASSVGETPLMRAAHSGNVTVIQRLLDAGADVSARESSLSQTALMRAVAENHLEAAQLLLRRGADPSARSKNGFTPLLFAAQQGNIDIARSLLAAGAQVDEAAPDGIGGDTNSLRTFRPGTEATALLVAIDSQHEAMARFLLEQGANPNAGGTGRTALHSAVQQAMTGLIGALLQHGADPNARTGRPMPLLSRFIGQQTGLEVNPLGATPFWWAASYGDVDVMRMLLEWGADPWINSDDGTTPLMVAAGVDFVEGQDKYGRRWFSLDTTVLQERAKAAVELCLSLGLDINAVNDKGQTALHGGVYFGGTTFAPFLISKGARVNVLNKRGQTPWLITQGEYQAGSFIEHKETGKVLEQLGADTSLGHDIGADGVTRLLRAASSAGRPQ